MTIWEVVLLVVGFFCVCISFFIGEKKDSSEPAESDAHSATDVWTEREEQMIRNRAAVVLEDFQTELVESTTDQMNRMCNEKIMAIDGFAQQLLEKIEDNHQEVVFMYNMLNEKEKEIAGIVTEPPKAASGTGTEPSGAAARETSKAGSGAGPAPRGTGNAAQGAPRVVQNAGPNRAQGQPAATAAVPVKQEEGKKSEPAATATDSSLMEGVSGDTILRVCKMYKEGKSVLEISKELGIGQGEVQLVITLYGGRRR